MFLYKIKDNYISTENTPSGGDKMVKNKLKEIRMKADIGKKQ